jgi:radical SAM protein with 4Fe4S-binding SPASM domain
LETLINNGIQVSRYVLQRIAPIMDKDGKVLKLNEEFIPNKEQVNVALSQIEEATKKYKIPIELVDPFPLCIVKEEFRYLITPCKCGLTDLSINGNGDVSRCGADPNYKLGNILHSQSDNPILELWKNSSVLACFRERRYLPEKCQTCKDKWLCGGGCEASCSIYKNFDKDHLEIFK